MWEDRDKAISDGYEKFNNEVIEKHSKDKDVRIGAKSRSKFWFGFKKHVSVDMQSGMINKVKVTKATMTDADGSEDVYPDGGAVPADKGYVPAIETIKEKDCHPMVILKNNMKENNKDKDRRLSGLRHHMKEHFLNRKSACATKSLIKIKQPNFSMLSPIISGDYRCWMRRFQKADLRTRD